MTDETTKKSAARSATELILFGVGGWFTVSSAMALAGSAPHANVLTRPVVLCMGWIGAWPTAAASLGLALVGAWSFLGRAQLAWARHALGAVGIGLGLAIGLGALRADAGGELGRILPSLLPGALGAAAGAGMGLALLFATAWLAWLPEESGFSGNAGEEGPIPAAQIPDDDGVSSAEAQALLAEPPHPAPVAALPRAASAAEDVRRRGGVPEGTRPLATSHDRTRPKAPDQALPRAGEAPAGAGPVSPLARIWLPREQHRCAPAAFWAVKLGPPLPAPLARPR